MIPIRPGTVFAAGPGLTIVEIGECSELTLGIHNWGIELPDGDDLLLEEAFDLIDFKRFSPAPPSGDDGFKVTRMELVNPLHIFSEQPGDFAIYHCVSGEAVLLTSRLGTQSSSLRKSMISCYFRLEKALSCLRL